MILRNIFKIFIFSYLFLEFCLLFNIPQANCFASTILKSRKISEKTVELCIPWDKYEVILVYDNSQGSTPAQYSYTKSVGISGTNRLTLTNEKSKKVNKKDKKDKKVSKKPKKVKKKSKKKTEPEIMLEGKLAAKSQTNGTTEKPSAKTKTNAKAKARQGGNAQATTTSPGITPRDGNSESELSSAELDLFGGLSEKFQLELGISETTGYEWYKASSDTFQMEKSTLVQVIVEPGYRVTVYQVVGHCGVITVRPDHIYIHQEGTAEAKIRTMIDLRKKKLKRWIYKATVGLMASLFSASYFYFGENEK